VKPLRVAVVFNDDAGALAAGEAKDRIALAGAASMAGAISRAVAERGHFAVAIPIRADIIEAAATLAAARPAVVFNVCEGFAGRARLEGAVAGVLDLLGLAYTGSPPETLYLAQDKARMKAVLAAAGVRVPSGGVLSSADGPLPPDLRFPCFVKTRFEDASHGIADSNLCADEASLRRRAGELIASWRQDVLVEEFLPGREFNVALLEGVEVQVLPISEIDFTRLAPGKPRVLTYDAKWLEDSPDYQKTPVICPAAIDAPLRDAIAATARAAWAAAGCRGYARVDIRLDPDGRPVVLEVNPNPDISPDAGFARSASRAGIAHDELIDRIIGLALSHSPR
jgi:D-alanine-D-alanine ligase